jgi:hypothetical protein
VKFYDAHSVYVLPFVRRIGAGGWE